MYVLTYVQVGEIYSNIKTNCITTKRIWYEDFHIEEGELPGAFIATVKLQLGKQYKTVQPNHRKKCFQTG